MGLGGKRWNGRDRYRYRRRGAIVKGALREPPQWCPAGCDNLASLPIISILIISAAMNTPFPPAKSVGLLIHDVARLLRRRIDQRAQAVGLTSAQWRVLSVVARAEFKNEEPPNQAALADQMDLEPITLSR